jgi:hypothetical protein
VFLIQAENDYSLAPSRVLSKEASKKHKDFQSKIYPTFGSNHQDGLGILFLSDERMGTRCTGFSGGTDEDRPVGLSQSLMNFLARTA